MSETIQKLKSKPKLLLIAPLPPPLTGQSIISQTLYEELKDEYNIVSINYSRKDVGFLGKVNKDRVFRNIELGKMIKKESINSNIIYC